MIKYVTGFMLSPDYKQVALITKNKPSWQANKLNGIGGKIESGETPSEAMAREFEEETGVITSPNEWVKFVVLIRESDYEVNFFYLVSEKVFGVVTKEDEEVSIYDVANLPENAIFNLKWLIPLSTDKKINFKNPIIISDHTY